jgi:hypothetical protein
LFEFEFINNCVDFICPYFILSKCVLLFSFTFLFSSVLSGNGNVSTDGLRDFGHGSHSLEFVGGFFFLGFHGDELSLNKLFVSSIEFDEVLVITAFDNFTLVEDDNLVGILDGTQTMSDNDNGLLSKLDQLVESLLHLMLTFRV